MSRAYGWNAVALVADENQYDVMPNSGFKKIPFASSTIDSEIGRAHV